MASARAQTTPRCQAPSANGPAARTVSVGRPESRSQTPMRSTSSVLEFGLAIRPAGTAVRAYSDGPNCATPGGIWTSVSAPVAESASAVDVQTAPGAWYSSRAWMPGSDVRWRIVTLPPRMVVPAGGVNTKSAPLKAGMATPCAANALSTPLARQALPAAPAPHAPKPAPTAARRPVWSADG